MEFSLEIGGEGDGRSFVTRYFTLGNERPANWTQWSDWSSCSKPCGTGQQTRIRLCNRTEIEDCIGHSTETRQCNINFCEAAVFNITAVLIEWLWNDSLLVKSSADFVALEDTLRHLIAQLYLNNPVEVKLLSCRKGSVIITFSINFDAVDSEQVVKLTEGMEYEGLLSEFGSVTLVNITANKVPDQAPAIMKTYLTSATSLRVSWTAVKEPVAGYQVAFRSISAGEWTSVYASSQTLSMHLENLKKGDVYRLRIAAFNAAGNGVPSDGTEIHMKEGVPRAAPEVSVLDTKTATSLIISWTAIPEEYVTGELLGYHITYKPMKLSDQRIDETDSLTVFAPATGKHELTLDSLSPFTQYSITVAGYTAEGHGQTSEAVLGETCNCPKTLYTNWVLYPPYVTEVNQQPAGIIGELIQEMILYSCGLCHKEQGETFLDINNNGKGASARKPSMGEVQADVDDRTHITFPVLGNMDDDKYLKEFVFVPVVQSPGIAFISLANQLSRTEVVTLTWNRSLPIVFLIVVMGFIVAVLIWIAEKRSKTEYFSHSFLRGTGDLTWFSFTTMTTVGFGEKVPVDVVSRLITIVWIVIGLVLISIFLANLTVSLTIIAAENRSALYGAKVTALRDSPSHRLGILRNARVETKETLEEAFEALQHGETEGFLLDAYVAGSGADSFIKTPYQVNKIIDTKKGLGVVLSGDAVVLRHRVRDFVKKNAEKITAIIQNSTSPLRQPKQSEVEENAQSLVSSSSPVFRDAITVTAGALCLSMLIGMTWELFRKRRKVRVKGHSEEALNSQRAEMAEIVKDFHIHFTQACNRLREKHKKQLQMQKALTRGEKKRRCGSKVNTFTTQL